MPHYTFSDVLESAQLALDQGHLTIYETQPGGINCQYHRESDNRCCIIGSVFSEETLNLIEAKGVNDHVITDLGDSLNIDLFSPEDLELCYKLQKKYDLIASSSRPIQERTRAVQELINSYSN